MSHSCLNWNAVLGSETDEREGVSEYELGRRRVLCTAMWRGFKNVVLFWSAKKVVSAGKSSRYSRLKIALEIMRMELFSSVKDKAFFDIRILNRLGMPIPYDRFNPSLSKATYVQQEKVLLPSSKSFRFGKSMRYQREWLPLRKIRSDQ